MGDKDVRALMLMSVILPLCFASVISTTSAISLPGHSFVIENDQFVRDGVPFRIIGGDLHYFRVLPELWKDRLLRAKALGLNTIQTYVPWNFHEPRSGLYNFQGSADLRAFLSLAQDLDLLVMLRIGPYICGEWDLGGLPAWLLELKPSVRLRSSNEQFLNQVDKWWTKLLPIVARTLFSAGGPVIMVQIENEYGSYGSDRVYLEHLLDQARLHLGNNVILYTTDGAGRETLSDGSLSKHGVFAAIDFPTGSDPASAFALQKEYNPPGMAPSLTAEFYTGWLSHWGERLAHTDALSTANALDSVLQLNASVVLYMAHGGTNFGFSSGANTGDLASEFQPDLTSYDYDAPIGEAGDVSSAKFQSIRTVLSKYANGTLPEPPPLPERIAYGEVTMLTIGSLFDILEHVSQPSRGIRMEWPLPMEQVKQASGFILYRSKLPASIRPGSKLSIIQVYDRAQVFVGSTTTKRLFVGTLERWSHNTLVLPAAAALAGLHIDILVENMGRVNYGLFMGERKGITEAVLVDDEPVLGWTAYSIELNEVRELSSRIKEKKTVVETASSLPRRLLSTSNSTQPALPLVDLVSGPQFYEGVLNVEKPCDTFLSFKGWVKGVAFINGFNLGRFWPSMGPQCTLYVPGPLLKRGDNHLVILELESSSQAQTVQFTDKADFTCTYKF
jgi:beta-galactosidase